MLRHFRRDASLLSESDIQTFSAETSTIHTLVCECSIRITKDSYDRASQNDFLHASLFGLLHDIQGPINGALETVS